MDIVNRCLIAIRIEPSSECFSINPIRGFEADMEETRYNYHREFLITACSQIFFLEFSVMELR